MVPEIVILALEYYRAPLSYPALADPAKPLPAGVEQLIGSFKTVLSDENIDSTAARLNATPDECRKAVLFFIRQVLFHKHADYYRQLGLDNNATTEQIKLHYRHLISVFHPDRDTVDTEWDEVYVPRLNEAYNTLRNPEKRKSYDQQSHEHTAPPQHAVSAQTRHRVRSTTAPAKPPRRIKPAYVAVGLALAFVLVITFMINSANREAVELTITELPEQREPVQKAAQKEPHQAAIEQETIGKAETVEVLQEQAIPATDTMQSRIESELAIQKQVEEQVALMTTAILGRPDPVKTKTVPTQRQPKQTSRAAEQPAKAAPAPVQPQADPEEIVAASAGSALEPANETPQQSTVQADLFRLLAMLITYYNAGDLDRFVGLFSDNAVVTGGEGIKMIRKFYTEIFARQEIRQMAIENFAWQQQFSNRYSGKGDLLVQLTAIPDGNQWIGSGKINLDVDLSSGTPRITAMFHQINDKKVNP